MANETGRCVVSLDCPGLERCYFGFADAPQGTGVCLCNAWFGKTAGPDCRDFSPAGVVQLVWTLGLAVVALLMLGGALRDLYANRREVGELKYNAGNAAMAHAAIGFACFVTWQLLYAAELTATTTAQDLATGAKTSELGAGSSIMVLLMQIAILNGLLNISVVWLEVSEGVRTMSHSVTSRISQYKRGVHAVGFLFAVTMITVAAAGPLKLAGFLSVPFNMVVVVVFGFGRRSMVRILTRAESSGIGSGQGGAERFGRAIESIKRCSYRVILAASSMTISSIIFFAAATAMPEDRCAVQGPGGVWCIPALASKLQATSALLVLWGIAGYCHECNMDKSTGSGHKLSRPSETGNGSELEPTTFRASSSTGSTFV